MNTTEVKQVWVADSEQVPAEHLRLVLDALFELHGLKLHRVTKRGHFCHYVILPAQEDGQCTFT